MKLFLVEARRLSLPKHSSLFLPLYRSLSSSPLQPETTQNPPQSEDSKSPLPRRPQLIPIQPVSYSPRPKHETQQQGAPPSHASPQQQAPPIETPNQPVTQEARSSWTLEDLRYVKNVPSVMPVSYPTRIAPLPEDRAPREERKEMNDLRKEESGDMERERQRIEMENREMRRAFRIAVDGEKGMVPFPMLIKPEKKNEKRPVLDLMDAIRQVKANAKAAFDETLEAHVRLAVDQKRSELIVRGTMALPHGAKKGVRVAVFAEGADADEARDAGADIVGGVELIEEIASAGKIEFDRCFSTPKVMPKLFKISRILNQHGLMPNPKQGTVTKDVTKAIKEAKEGQVKFRMDKTSIVHVGLGKVSFSEESLRDNIGAFMNALLLAKPAGLKKTSKYAGYVNSFHICGTMSPGFPVSIQSLSRAADHYSKVYLTA
ncbi:hypothetical protein SLEP1_g27683 [Rubroshorea leprosula]|uniref:Large ribosomal subunit protein uL1c n=1 Tax=Rubroshorea leprosula TaxID=152421 RepID=A0AAV5JTX5_9ROSI|nr:hypothetical protein SLEP1_g27683 [Rubroshorea leprosula]